MKRIISLFTALLLLLSLAIPASAGSQVPEDGLYSVGVISSSKMFRITGCLLDVRQGQMTAIVTLSSSSYGYLFQGTAEQADAVSQDHWIAPIDPEQKAYSFRLPVPALDEPVDVAAWSKKYEKWYDRQLTFLSGSLHAEERSEKKATPIPDDGRYQIDAHTDSPLLKVESCVLTVENGQMHAQISIADSKYALLYPGLAKDALQAEASTHISLLADSDGKASALVPVSALDEDLPLSTWSSKKNLWYDRTLRLDSATLKPLLETQEGPSFAFSGGSGRTTISLKSLDESSQLATIVFSSPHYTQVKLAGNTYLNALVNKNWTLGHEELDTKVE